MQFDAWQQMVGSASQYIGKLPGVAFTILATWILSRLALRIAVGTGRLARTDPTILSLVVSGVKFVAWVLGFAAVFNALGLTQISLALGGSIALIGAALATGLSTIPQDLLAGIFLIGDEEFTVGRKIKAANIEGRLEEITIRKTRIRDEEGNLHTIPNRMIDQSVYTVYRRSDEPS